MDNKFYFPKGELIIDEGAKQALKKGKSLLAAGIKVTGRFNKGDHIKIVDKNNKECARGLGSFSSLRSQNYGSSF